MSKDQALCIGVLLAALSLGVGTACAASQKVFRCGPDGRTYSQTPCKEGSSVEVNANDKRSAEQRNAEAAVKREAEMAEKMRRDRMAQEAAAAKQDTRVAAKPVAAEPSASAVAKKKKKPTPKPAQS